MIKYPLARPLLGESEHQAVSRVLQSGHLVQGPEVQRLETALSELTGMSHAIACSSGTAALHLALSAIAPPRDAEVLVPAFGYPATANAVELVGARTRFVDIDPETLCPAVASLEARLTSETVGFVPVHPFGLPAPIEAYGALAQARGLWLLQDAACALGTDLKLGWADARFPTCLSFHPRKTITTAEGGMVLTNDPTLARTMLQKRNHGVDGDIDGWLRFETAGFNYRLSDLAASIGVVQLGRLDTIVDKRRQLASWYRERLVDHDDFHWFSAFDRDGLAIQSMVIRLDDQIDRDAVIHGLLEEGIQTTIAGYSIAEQPYYMRKYGCTSSDFPNATRLFRQGLTLPLLHDMAESDVDLVCETLKRITHHARG